MPFSPGSPSRTTLAQPQVELSTLDGGTIPELRDEWEGLEAVSRPSPYLTFAWLASWCAVYAPRRMRVVRISAPGGRLIALGLLEQATGGGLRFAGGPVTAHRGLLVRPGDAAAAWAALAGWLSEHPRRWGYVVAEGFDLEAHRLLRARSTPVPWFSLELESDFAEYLAARPASVGKRLVRKLRTAERAGAVAAPADPGDMRAALSMFVALHGTRAESKGERHRHIDERLTELLHRVATRPGVGVAVVVLRQDAATLAVTVRLDYERGSWFYNAGFDPAATRLSPGIVVELHSIRHAIERGQRRYDLGPGDYRYKRELGGVERTRFQVRATSRSPRGRALEVALAARTRARAPRSA